MSELNEPHTAVRFASAALKTFLNSGALTKTSYTKLYLTKCLNNDKFQFRRTLTVCSIFSYV